MPTAHQHQPPLPRLLTSVLTAMWKAKRFFFILFISVTCFLFAVYILFGTGTIPPLRHPTLDSHLHSQLGLKHPAEKDLVVAKPSLLQVRARNGSDDVRPKPGGGSAAPKPLLKVVVLTYKRAKSLQRCLASLNEAVYDGGRVEVEIYVDRGKDEKVHNDTARVASSFAFKHGHVRVFVRPRHGGVVAQWLSSWRVPRDNASEIAVFVEDDLTLSPFFARWLWRVHAKYDGYPGVNGYSLQGESIQHAVGSKGMVHGPAGQSVFLYPVVGSWGFSPNTGFWREFLRWYHEASQDPKFLPLVPGLKPSGWYQVFARSGRTETMWTMWHIYHATKNHHYTLYPNLPDRKGLSFNWKEPGEHYSNSLMGKGLHAHTLETWREEDVRLPEKLVIVDAKGKITGQKMSPLGLE